MASFTSRIQAWFYPGVPATNANEEYSDGRNIYILKPEYYTINSSGVLTRKDDPTDGENAYSVANALDVKRHSSHQYFTISGNAANMATLCGDGTKRTNAVNTIKSFLDTIGFDGVELDWEGYSTWTTQSYADFKTFVGELVTTLHTYGYKVMVDVPPIHSVTHAAYGQNLFKIKYEEIDALGVDYIVSMAYDYQYDYGSPEPVSPTAFVELVCDWAKDKIKDINKIVIGMPSYGYHETTGGYDIDGKIDTKAQSAIRTGYGTATRNADFEMVWATGGVSSIYQDSSGINSKRDVIEAKGIKNISVWHLGGNDWFTTKTEAPIRGLSSGRTSVSSRVLGTSRTLASSRRLI
jgi:spore germination protein YaaH